MGPEILLQIDRSRWILLGSAKEKNGAGMNHDRIFIGPNQGPLGFVRPK